jgi:hypothetical protein
MTGKHVVNSLTDFMWYMDPFWGTLEQRSIRTPDDIKHLTGHRHLKEQKKKIPQVQSV